MKEIPYLELVKDQLYYLIITFTYSSNIECQVKFESYATDSVNLKVKYNDDPSFRNSNVDFDNFIDGKASIFSITDDELKILKIT